MRLKCFKKFCFVLMLTGLYSCGSMEGAADSTPISNTSIYSGYAVGQWVR